MPSFWDLVVHTIVFTLSVGTVTYRLTDDPVTTLFAVSAAWTYMECLYGIPKAVREELKEED